MAGEAISFFPVDAIRGANLELVETTQHIEQHHRELVDAAQTARVPDSDHVEPAAAPGPPRDGAVLVTAIAQVLAGGIILLAGKRPAADTRRVGFHDANAAFDVAG